MIRKILIANRGEIAIRIIRACREMGIETVAVYSEADREALHTQLADEAVCIGPAAAKDSYLNMEQIISATMITGADAIHPGFGFLSENSQFAKLCEACHITFIGPDSDIIARLGNKAVARQTMVDAGVPVIPGCQKALTDVKEALEEMNIDLNVIEDEEPDAALGNGGLGRLAACFLDSLATLNYPAYGCGIRYRYGMFKQKIENGYQVEVPDNWLKEGNPFEIRREEYAKEVRFGGNIRFEKDPVTGKDKFIQENYESVMAVPYDMPVVGYGNHVVNTLRVWDAKPITDFKLS